METFATAYPVIFNDGEHDLDKGHVGIHSVLSFKKFQAQMSRIVGIPANQLSAVFVCRRTIKDTEKRQKLPINETTNFNIILNQHNPSRERDCHFLVSMKKSKKERKGTRKRNAESENVDDEDSNSSRGDVSPSDERPKQGSGFDSCFSEAASPTSILQRPLSPAPSPSNSVGSSSGSDALASYNKVNSAAADNNNSSSNNNNNNNNSSSKTKGDRLLLRHEIVTSKTVWQAGCNSNALQRVEGFNLPADKVQQRFNDVVQQQPASIRAAQSTRPASSSSSSSSSLSTSSTSSERCQLCRERNVEFHFCVNDMILVGFRTSPAAGPIQRPSPSPSPSHSPSPSPSL